MPTCRRSRAGSALKGSAHSASGRTAHRVFFPSRSMPTAIAEHWQVFDEAPSSALPPVSMARSPRGPRSRGKKDPWLGRTLSSYGGRQSAGQASAPPPSEESFSFYECRRAWGRCEGIGASDSVWVSKNYRPDGQPLGRSPSVADMAPRQREILRSGRRHGPGIARLAHALHSADLAGRRRATGWLGDDGTGRLSNRARRRLVTM